VGGATYVGVRKTQVMFMRATFLLILCCVAPMDAALAQAGTGGTKDSAAPTMVMPIRPRDEARGTTAVPNYWYQQQYVPRLRRSYPTRLQRR